MNKPSVQLFYLYFSITTDNHFLHVLGPGHFIFNVVYLLSQTNPKLSG